MSGKIKPCEKTHNLPTPSSLRKEADDSFGYSFSMYALGYYHRMDNKDISSELLPGRVDEYAEGWYDADGDIFLKGIDSCMI